MGRRVKSKASGAALLLALAVGLGGLGARAQGAGGLLEVGPVDPSHGFPLWYMDSTGLTLQLCLDPNNPLCAVLPDSVPNPGAPIVFPTNFPDEAFWWAAEATMTTAGGGSALLVLAAEAAFANELPAAGDQVSFGRVRIRVDNLQAGATYRVVHPYGEDVFTLEVGGDRSINFTEDIGIGAPGDFTGILDSRIGPFLVWEPLVEAPLGYVGDPAVPHRVSGSPLGTNVFRIEGPNVGEVGSPFLCPDRPGDVHCIQTDLFSVSGQIATVAGAGVHRASYTRSAEGTFVDAFASSLPGQQLRVGGEGVPTTPMRGDARGRYFARLQLTGELPGQLQVENASDVPASLTPVRLVDSVTITQALYDTGSRQLRIEASSSDALGAPALTAEGLGVLSGGVLVLLEVDVPPEKVVVVSAAGGRSTREVAVQGPALAPVAVVAAAGADQAVQQGQAVVLDGSASSGDGLSFSWVQVGGTPVTLQGAQTATATFTAPSVADTLLFELSVSGPAGSATDTVSVVVEAVEAPVANAGADQVAVQGALVTLDGSASLHTSAYSWTQVGGPVVELGGSDTARPSFVFPTQDAVLTFQLTALGPGGSSTDTVQVSNQVDVLTVAEARYRTRDREWRVRGSATVLRPGNTVTLHVGPTLDGPVLGTATVDVDGTWSFRARGSAVAPDATATVSLRTSAGGVLLGVGVTVRN